MALTATQRADMQVDLGITDDQKVFTDAELDRLYERAGGDYDRAVYLARKQLLSNAARFIDYTAGQTRVEKAQVFEHLSRLVDRDAAQLAAKNQVRIVGMREVPPRDKDTPDA